MLWQGKRLKFFGGSSVDLNRQVNLVVDINLSNHSENQRDLFVCEKQCYTKLLKLDNALNRVERIKSKLKTEFKKNQNKTRFKQLCQFLIIIIANSNQNWEKHQMRRT